MQEQAKQQYLQLRRYEASEHAMQIQLQEMQTSEQQSQIQQEERIQQLMQYDK